ncbi:hypothetical protein H4219_001418 [Mycoemilia scoparia]|uniref:Uncharacterized protein n=1 Tax=Mycoemilia scoparia TaxID=417184 RepID=A0A9W8A8A2_9FUNG|nr:hypothetical protein H4219_001418 [Mycoemilia scoparia]
MENVADDIQPYSNQEYVALFRKTTDTLLFSNPALISKSQKLPKLPSELQYITVHASLPSSGKKTLKDVTAYTAQIQPTMHNVEKPMKEPKGLDYGPYSSFAPQYDSRTSTLPSRYHEWIYATTKETEKDASAPTTKKSAEEESDKLDLSNDAVEKLLEQANYMLLNNNKEIKIDSNEMPSDLSSQLDEILGNSADDSVEKEQGSHAEVNKLLKRNTEILMLLNNLHHERVRSGKIDQIGLFEKQLAQELKTNFLALAKITPPKYLRPTQKAIRSAMRSIPFMEEVYSGTLPPQKCFGFSTNAAEKTGFNASHTSIPPHARKQV